VFPQEKKRSFAPFHSSPYLSSQPEAECFLSVGLGVDDADNIRNCCMAGVEHIQAKTNGGCNRISDLCIDLQEQIDQAINY